MTRRARRNGAGGRTVLEPDVTLTDLGLAIECAVLAMLLVRDAGAPASRWFAAFFAVLSAAAGLGAAEHGFVADKASTPGRMVWTATLLAVGLAAVAGWGAAARLVLGRRTARAVTAGVAVAFAGYAAVVVGVDRRFLVAIAFYLPAAIVLLVAFVRVARRGVRGAIAGAWGMGLTFVAAAVQQGGVALHPRYFDHNALYHVIQAVGLYLVFRGARAATRG
ncbi:hypothetical protein [Anaeromyxobacter sp. Fw109-5]|uniref:DUF6962 family protein n=1 Tax=Anaeromyxobacter sp. (strain Fw109-5) TaxID=404589 RepID=UPI00059E7CAA|nr:hypothetical protein [Anaeromyxobacter sp. Fw109-5]